MNWYHERKVRAADRPLRIGRLVWLLEWRAAELRPHDPAEADRLEKLVEWAGRLIQVGRPAGAEEVLSGAQRVSRSPLYV